MRRRQTIAAKACSSDKISKLLIWWGGIEILEYGVTKNGSPSAERREANRPSAEIRTDGVRGLAWEVIAFDARQRVRRGGTGSFLVTFDHRRARNVNSWPLRCFYGGSAPRTPKERAVWPINDRRRVRADLSFFCMSPARRLQSHLSIRISAGRNWQYKRAFGRRAWRVLTWSIDTFDKIIRANHQCSRASWHGEVAT